MNELLDHLCHSPLFQQAEEVIPDVVFCVCGKEITTCVRCSGRGTAWMPVSNVMSDLSTVCSVMSCASSAIQKTSCRQSVVCCELGAWQLTWHLNNPHHVRLLSTANSLANPPCPHMPRNQGWFSVGSDSNIVIVWLLVCHFQLSLTFDSNLSFSCVTHSAILLIWKSDAAFTCVQLTSQSIKYDLEWMGSKRVQRWG